MYYVTEMLSPLSEYCASDAQKGSRDLIVYTGNAWRDTARLSVEFYEDNRMRTAPHSSYSLNIALFEFDLFRCVKRCLADRSFVNAEERFEAVGRALARVEKVTLQAVFLEWVDRLRKYIQTNGDYIK